MFNWHSRKNNNKRNNVPAVVEKILGGFGSYRLRPANICRNNRQTENTVKPRWRRNENWKQVHRCGGGDGDEHVLNTARPVRSTTPPLFTAADFTRRMDGRNTITNKPRPWLRINAENCFFLCSGADGPECIAHGRKKKIKLPNDKLVAQTPVLTYCCYSFG